MTARRSWSVKTRMAVLDSFNRICQLCQQPIVPAKGFDLDHRIPLAMGGEDVVSNLQPLCNPCHRLKTKGDVGAIAKARRAEAKHYGVRARKGKPLPFGRASPYRKKINGDAVPR